MDTANYVAITRQRGLMSELQIIANNVANAATSGYRSEGVVFAEMIEATNSDDGSISMSDAHVRFTSNLPGTISTTNARLDVAIQGSGFFQVETPSGVRLTRSGAFALNAANEIVTSDGYRVLDAGGAPIFVPPDDPNISISTDGTISNAAGNLSQIGVVAPPDESSLIRSGGVLFEAPEGAVQVDDPFVLQGRIESSNVNVVREIARLIEVQRAYESTAKFLEREDERIKAAVRTLGEAK